MLNLGVTHFAIDEGTALSCPLQLAFFFEINKHPFKFIFLDPDGFVPSLIYFDLKNLKEVFYSISYSRHSYRRIFAVREPADLLRNAL